MKTFAEASISEEPGSAIPNAGICAGPAGQLTVLPQYWFGGRVVRIDRFYPSSQLCSVCGVKYPGLRLKDREWTCQNCGTHHDRDVNAARNIHAEALRLLNQTPVVATSGS
jgi:putative transposase